MARLSKNKRIRQHKKVYGRIFVVEASHHDEPVEVTVKVTKLVRKGPCDNMFVVCTGIAERRIGMFESEARPFKFWARVAFTQHGPAYFVKGGSNHISSPELGREIVRGCENILLEVTILGDDNEQDTKASISKESQTQSEEERRT